jgi:TPR repeat protein
MGDGCEYDGQKAFECYKSAAKAKNAIALYRLASCYDRGIGTEQNFNQAFKYYFRSASLGYDPARYEAGKMMMSGRGTKKSPDEAYKMFSSAAKNGYAAAEYEVANCFFEGVGAIRNRTSAYRYYLRAYDSQSENRADAAYRLGLCHLKGLGTEQDSGEAFEWFSRGASLGSAEAMYMLGLEDSDKGVIFSVLREDKATEAMQALEDKFHTIKNGKGIAFTIPMSSVIGVAIYRFLSNHRS